MGADLSYSAATLVGMTVTAEVELVADAGRKLRFEAVCRDDAEVISAGYHERSIINADRLLPRSTRR